MRTSIIRSGSGDVRGVAWRPEEEEPARVFEDGGKTRDAGLEGLFQKPVPEPFGTTVVRLRSTSGCCNSTDAPSVPD